MKAINRKLGKLENCVLDKSQIDLKTTQIAYECLSEAEQKLMDQSHEIAAYWDRDTELTESQRKILVKAGQILSARIGWLFYKNLELILGRDDSLAKFFISTRLFWFVDELITFIRQYQEECRIFDQKGKTWKQKEKEAEGLYKNWKKPFTPESYTKFMKPVFKHVDSDLKKRGLKK